MTSVATVYQPEVNVSSEDSKVSVNVCETVVQITTGNAGPQGPRGTQVLSGVEDPSIVIGLVGDQYLNVESGFLFGPKTELGWGDGIAFGLTLSQVSYVHYQTSAASVWTIEHDLLFVPNITVVDLDGKVVEGDYQYSGSTIIATFSQSILGAAYLS